MQKTKITLYTRLSAALAALCCGGAAKSQQPTLSYITELQYDFHDKAKWVNLLQTEMTFDINPHLSAAISTISTCSTDDRHLLPDLLTYSNIEEENIALALGRAGVSLSCGRWDIFGGIGNVNDNFFTTPLTSLFTNSSCGIFPTVSCNFDIANFPNASTGIEARYENSHIAVNSAIYNGKGSHRFNGSESVFRVAPHSDGIFNINDLNYHRHDNNYNMGFGLYHGRSHSDEAGAQQTLPSEVSSEVKTQIFYWLYAEQKIIHEISVIAQFSQCPSIKYGCRSFYGAGIACNTGRYDLGLYSCHASFTDSYEWASELTFRYRLSASVDLQSSLHYIRNTTSHGPVGLLRLTCRI